MGSSSHHSNSNKDGHQKSIFSTLMRSVSGSSVNMNSHHHSSHSNRHHDIMLQSNNSAATVGSRNSNGNNASGMHLSSTGKSGPSTNTSSKSGSSSAHTNMFHSSSKHSKKKYKDLNEDWSAVVEDFVSKDEDFLMNEVRNSSNMSRTNSQMNLSKIVSSSSSVNGSNNKPLSKEEAANLTLELESEKSMQELSVKLSKINRFDRLLNDTNPINLTEIRKIAWNGVPTIHRPLVWKLLIGYLPANKRRHQTLLARKRNEYKLGIDHIFSEKHQRDQPTWHQIKIDIPRTNPHIKLYQYRSVQDSLQKILYYWAIRHPASGYVQGINDLVTPFYQSFLTEYLPEKDVGKVELLDPETYLSEEQFVQLEADSFWCLTKFLDTITDNYIHGQPGILKQVSNLESLCKRIDLSLYNHLRKENVEFLQFAFRWMNCLLMREFPMEIVIRMWDTYLAETSSDEDMEDENLTQQLDSLSMANNLNRHTGQNAANESSHGSSNHAVKENHTNSATSSKRRTSLGEFHVFVCAAFLENWANVLLQMDFQGIITFLQNVPTTKWKESDIELLLSEAYMWQTLYKDATSHWL